MEQENRPDGAPAPEPAAPEPAAKPAIAAPEAVPAAEPLQPQMPLEQNPHIPAASAIPATASAIPAVPAHADGPDPVKWRFPSVHPEGVKFAAIAGGAALLAFLFGWTVIGWLLVLFTVFTASFFRDPVRAIVAGEGLILSPADGLVSQIVEVELPRQIVGEDGLPAGRALRISVFMSVFDVHINRAPLAGRVTHMAYVPGAFLNADLDKASEDNERQYFVVEGAGGVRVGFTQIAGLVARRIIGFVRPGSIVAAGQRIGLIRFGSRVDVFLPQGYVPQVVKGQRAVAGETVLAARGRDMALPGARI